MTQAPDDKLFGDNFVKIVATFFGVGYFPWGPGTMASAAAVFLSWYLPTSAFFWVLGIFLFIGFLACKPAVRIFNTSDPSKFVMDEVVGMMIAVMLIPKTIFFYAAAFILFRFFDIVKPWPISIIQKSKLPRAIMLDDMLAGVFANLILWILIFIFPWIYLT